MNNVDLYKEISASSEAMGASFEHQIKLLLEKLIQDINLAIQAIQNDNILIKCRKITNAHEILTYLRGCIDFDIDREFSQRVDDICEHVQGLLFWANAKNDITKLEEAKTISNNLVMWWNQVYA